MSDNIKVVVKVRPLISREIEEKLFHQWRVKDNSIYLIDQGGRDCGNLFTFDKVYDENTNTTDVYNDIAKPIVEAATAGFNGTIFAYGQTSSGKTYTMTGTDSSPGLIPLSVINLFDIIKNISDRHFLIRVSYVEIYNETIIDLLNTEKKNIKIQDTFQGVKVDATVRVTTTPEEVFQFMKEGQANRQTGATNMNEESSRSHSIFQITIESREHTEGEEVGCLNISQLNLVDLAGSERSGQTGATGIRFKEGTHINKSLSSLALVIKQLSEGLSKHVNYRDSKLTRILQNSLGGNAKTSIICAVTPAVVEETISTLHLGNHLRGQANRQTGATNMNEESSRSHSIFQITIESREHTEGEEVGCLNISQLNLVDLAGSERSGQTGATGIRFKEGTHINKSLSSLALVIKQLSEGLSKHVNYRDSKLTRILQNSLGGNAKTSIICAVTPAVVEETISTLQFACRAKAIKNTPQVNVVATNNKVMENLTKELSTLKTQLESKKNVEEDNQKLQKQIAVLQRFLSGLVQRGSRAELTRPALPSRRATISAPPQHDDHTLMPPPSIKFCTPSLKYNPIVLGRSMETLPKQSTGGLASVPEEPRFTTPSPSPINTATDEVIEIDSDDDAPADVQTCSPYHKCFKSTKTPPCVLRKNAQEAERNLRDIVELTEREKIYKPDVVELLEKLENNSTVIAKLEEEIAALTSINKDNELNVEILNEKIRKNEAELQLEERCKEFVTKLTDWEVTYETLKKKSKTREDELLSRLEEYSNITKPVRNCKSPEITVLKDKTLSIVESDNSVSTEKSTCDSTSENTQYIITDLKEQLSVRDKNISELEANLLEQSQKVFTLENKTEELDGLLNSLKEKLANSEKEISLHKTTIDTLNNIVENQKCNLETATKDLQSYNDTIQELRNKLSGKQIVRYALDDTEIAQLIAIEEKSIANNENVANIIKSLQTALETKRNEIELLRSNVQKNEESDDYTTCSEKLESEAQQFKELEVKVKELTQQLQDIQTEKEELLLGKTNLLLSLEDLNNEFAVCANNKIELENKIKIYETDIKNIKERNEELLNNLNEKSNAVTELTAKNTELINQLKDYTDKISHLQNDIKLKDAEIGSMREYNNDNVNKIQALIFQLHDIQSIMKGKNEDCLTNNSPDIYEVLNEKLTDLRNNTSAIVSERDNIKEQYTILSTTITKTGDQFIAAIKSAIKDLETIQLRQKLLNESKTNENGIHEEPSLDNGDNEEFINVMEFSETKSLLEISGLITHMKQKIENIKLESKSSIDNFTHLLETRDSKIAELDQKINELNDEADKKSIQVISVVEECNTNKKYNYETVTGIVATILTMAQKLNIVHNAPCFNETDELRTYLSNHIVPILDKVVNLFLINNTEKDKNVLHANKEFECLAEQNAILNKKILQIEESRNELSKDLQEERENNKSLIQNLRNTSNLLNDLKEELKIKVDEIDSMKNKMLDWKDKFTKIESMKKEQNEVYEENMRLKEKCRNYELIQKEFEINSDSFLLEMKEKCVKESMQSDRERDSKSPLSLLTLSCNRIIQIIQDRDDASQTVTSVSSNSKLDEKSSESSFTCYQCNKLKTDLEYAQNKNHVLINLVEESKWEKENLMQEIKDASVEIKSLVDYTNDLQKRILSHKTNLSTLTATTYAENKSLSSQVKSLQHHHTRFHTVCQRDLPELKEQLHELMKLLREENLEGKLNASFKRFSLPSPLENNSILYSFKNESTLDGDLLMLDTNVTLVNSADNTLTGHDQTCFEAAEACLYNDTASQTPACYLHESHESCTKDNETIQSLKLENQKLNDLVEKLKITNVVKVDVETSPIKSNIICDDCKHHKEKCEQLIQEIEECKLIFTNLSTQKDDIEKKYNLEIQSTEGLMRKLNNFEKELANKNKSIEKLTTSLKDTKERLNSVQEENENLSTEIIESLSTVDSLKMELDSIKKNNFSKATVPPADNEENVKKIDKECPECLNKQEIIKILQSKNSNTHTRLNRSYSDSDSSSRYNKICTLQNEIVAGREDCNELKEEVTTIKNHLEIGNLSMGEAMDLDESISDVNVVELNKSYMPEISEEQAADIYSLDKTDCYNYYIELIGEERTNLSRDVKIIDIMKMLYSKLMTRHDNRIDNLLNKIRDYEALKHELQEKISNLGKALDESKRNTQKFESKFSVLINNTNKLSNAIESVKNNDINLIELFKTQILMVLDTEFSTNTLPVFETIYNNNLTSLKTTVEECVRLQENSQKLDNELRISKSDLKQLKDQLTAKENEYKILLAEKEKINEVSNTLTQDLHKQEKDLVTAVTEGYQKLIRENILVENYFDAAVPAIRNVNILFDKLVNQSKEKPPLGDANQIEDLKQEITNYKYIIEQKNKELQIQTEQLETIKKQNEKIEKELKENEGKVQTQKSLFDDINAIYNKKVEEYDIQVTLVQNLTEEVGVLKEFVSNKERIIQDLQSKLNNVETEYNNLKTINQTLINEKESMAAKLGKAEMEIENNKIDLTKMVSETNTLKESLIENVHNVDSLKNEAKSLMEQNVQLKQEFDQKCKDLARLEFNIKTHETTAKIQTNMISRLQKQKEDDMNIIAEKEKQLEELSVRLSSLQKECVGMKHSIESLRHEKDALTHLKLSLEDKICQLKKELEGGHKPRLSIESVDKICQLKKELEGGHKPRLSIESVVETARRRRQSIQDSNRTFGDKHHDQHKSEKMLEERCKDDDMMMDVDECSSSRSTPQRHSKGRDSLQREESDEEREGRRSAGGVRAARQRRQSSHDLHRLALHNTPSPHETRNRSKNEHDLSNDSNTNNRVSELQDRLTSCQQELEELKERYRELDEECETCAEYLRERDDQCRKLKKEKASLENIIKELNEKLQRGHDTSRSDAKVSYEHAAVNTDEDWANLHSVVVDRMSFDAEVEKNKRLTKIIEDLRMNKQELKAVMAKMQRALEEKTGKDGRELERTRLELRSCKEELEELRRRNVELDEECETCAQYLKEKEEQCRSLKESIAALEGKLSEQQVSGRGAATSVRRRRQSLHDHNRDTSCCDATTQITEDFLSSQVERDLTKPVPDDIHNKQIKRLKMAVEKLSKEKNALEQQLVSAATAPVDQQFTDVMKENQKLKKTNAALIALCKKREKKATVKSNRENQNPTEEI
ncbi:Centromere-associated protein E [Papilio machaon]|uniref:Centromere-associated protein E n=1 Tax=Papilio machaon TaxID=76193 RepID=A0A194QZY7_PAPMA|nr:Centromere-associated protein E [Papilio machaon]